ncbi:MAG: hypothetical protein WDO15_00270 [Bacteroidota bacterium]
MYFYVLALHNTFRWIALVFLVYSLCRSVNGYYSKRSFSKADNAFRHWTATILQIQMMLGLVLYFYSPFVDTGFFAIVHPVVMFIAVTIASVGSALAKRKPTDHQKFSTMLAWFAIALIIIAVMIPWPFSPFAQRPYIRPL